MLTFAMHSAVVISYEDKIQKKGYGMSKTTMLCGVAKIRARLH